MAYSKERNKVGAPKINLDVLPIQWYNEIIELYKEGASDVEVKAYIYESLGSFSNSLWDRWIKEEVEFSQTIKMGKVLSESWWSKTGRKNLENKEFSYTGWYMNMKNRFGWVDKVQQELSGQITTNIINLGDGIDPNEATN